MAGCQKCWREAKLIAHSSGRDTVEVYHELLEKRKDNPCTPREQAGDFWDEEKQCDIRFPTMGGNE